MEPLKRPMAGVLRSHPFLRFACPTKNLTPVIAKAKEELLMQDEEARDQMADLLGDGS